MRIGLDVYMNGNVGMLGTQHLLMGSSCGWNTLSVRVTLFQIPIMVNYWFIDTENSRGRRIRDERLLGRLRPRADNSPCNNFYLYGDDMSEQADECRDTHGPCLFRPMVEDLKSSLQRAEEERDALKAGMAHDVECLGEAALREASLLSELERLKTAILKVRGATSANYMGQPVHMYQDALMEIRQIVDIALSSPPAPVKK